MPVVDYLEINGTAYGHNTAEVRIDGDVAPWVTEINYDHGQENGEVRGTSAVQLGDVEGDYKPSAKVTMSKGQAQKYIDKWGDGYMQKRFPIVVSYAPPGRKLITDKLVRCKIKKETDSSKQGNDGNMVEWELELYGICKNGKKPIKGMVDA